MCRINRIVDFIYVKTIIISFVLSTVPPLARIGERPWSSDGPWYEIKRYFDIPPYSRMRYKECQTPGRYLLFVARLQYEQHEHTSEKIPSTTLYF